MQVTEGDAVLELSVVRTDKGEALEALRRSSGATATVFVGDDVSAEEVFVRLSGPDLGIKVGSGSTLAPYRIAGPGDVAAALSLLWEERDTWLYGELAVPIERLSMLGNGRSVALVTQTRGFAGSARRARRRRRCSRSCSEVPPPGTSRSGQSAMACPSDSAMCPAR